MAGDRYAQWMTSLLLLVLLAAPVRAQDGAGSDGTGAAPPISARLSSPAATLQTFLEAMNAQPPDFEAAIDCLDLGGALREAGEQRVIKLLGILNRIEVVRIDEHPDAQAVAGDAAPTSYLFFPRSINGNVLPVHADVQRFLDADYRIVLARGEDGAWRFSNETVAAIDDLYDAIQPLAAVDVTLRDETSLSRTLWIETQMPAWALERAMGLKYWQWIGLLVLIGIGVLIDQIVRAWLVLISRRIIRRRGGESNRESLRKTVRPFGITVMAVLWVYTLPLLDLPLSVVTILIPAVRLFAILTGVWAAFRATDLGAEVLASRAERTDNKFDDLLVPLIRKVVKIFITIFGVIYLAESLDIAIAPLLTAMGIGGVGFAFAAKDTLENFFGSVTVIVDRPFQVGDWITIGDVEGTVEELGLRSVRIRTFYNSLVTVPTANLVRTAVDNYGMRKYRRWSTHLNVTYDTPPDKIETFCEGIRELIRLHPYTRKDYYHVWLNHFGAHSLDIMLYIFHEAPDWNTELRERHRLMLDIIRLANNLGVEFAFPTQTLHMFSETASEGGQAGPMHSDDEAAAVRDGRAAVHVLTQDAPWRRERPGPHVIESKPVEDDGTQIESKIGGDAAE